MTHQPIHKAAEKGDIAALKAELAKGVSIDLGGIGGWTPLICAVCNTRLDAVKFLVEQKATVDKTEDAGWTALHYACSGGRSEIAALLLDNDAELNKQNRHGETALMKAVIYRQSNCVKLLLERKADTTVKATGSSYKDKTPSDVAQKSDFGEIVALLQAASTAAPAPAPPAPPAPRVELAATTGAPPSVAKADNELESLLQFASAAAPPSAPPAPRVDTAAQTEAATSLAARDGSTARDTIAAGADARCVADKADSKATV